MISEFNSVRTLLEEIDSKLDEKVSLYAIGGIVLVHRGLKPATKDLDLIAPNSHEYHQVKIVLKQLKFLETKPEFGYDHFNLSQIMKRNDYRIDLFSEIVCQGLSLSEGMIQRAEKVIELSKLTLYFCSNEDVFLFKTMTNEREILLIVSL